MTKVIVDRGLLRYAASVLRGVVHTCQPRPRQSYEDGIEFVGGQALEEADQVSDALAADAPSVDEVVGVLEEWRRVAETAMDLEFVPVAKHTDALLTKLRGE